MCFYYLHMEVLCFYNSHMEVVCVSSINMQKLRVFLEFTYRSCMGFKN